MQSLTERVGELETELAEATSTRDETEQQLSVIEDDIADLREQIAELDQGSGGGSSGADSP